MHPYPPIFPEPFDCHRPCRPQRPECEWPCELCPANVTACVLGMDSCGGIIIRIQRQQFCNSPCDRPQKPCCDWPQKRCDCPPKRCR